MRAIERPLGQQTCACWFLIVTLVVAAVPGTARAIGRNLVLNPGFESGETAWESFGSGFTIDRSVRHAGEASLRCHIDEIGAVTGAMQTIVLDQSTAAPFVISAWSKADDVSSTQGPHYSLWCDIEYTTDTRPGRVDLPGEKASFTTGTHDWERQELIVSPEAPVKSLNLYVLFRHRYTGTVWFDDVNLETLTNSPLQGTSADFSEFSTAVLPPELSGPTSTVPTDKGRVLLKVSQNEAEQPIKTIPVWIDGTEFALAEKASGSRTIDVPFDLARSRSALPFQERGVKMVTRQMHGEFILSITRRKCGSIPLEAWLLLPEKMRLAGTAFRHWDTRQDNIRLGRLNNRILIKIGLGANTDRIHLELKFHREKQAIVPAVPAPAFSVTKAHTIGSTAGLQLNIGNDGVPQDIFLSGQKLPALNAPSGSHWGKVPLTGFILEDVYTGEVCVLKGKTDFSEPDGTLLLSASLPSIGIGFQADFRPNGERIDIQARLRNTFGGDRAMRLSFSLPVNLSGWLAWEDIDTTQALKPEAPFDTDIYPWTCFTPVSEKGSGICMALAPDIPHRSAFHGSVAEGPRIAFDVGLSDATAEPGTVSIHFVLFPCDGRWGFRDASRRYYAMFPDAFRAISNTPGGWLFAFPAKNLPNPEDYAYREGGPAGWQLDDKLGLLTCPYRIPTQRQIVFSELPATDSEAAEKIRQLAEKLIPVDRKQQEGAALCKKNHYASMMLNCSSHDRQGMPYTVRRDNVGADVLPKNPIYNVVYSVNCDPDLYNDREDTITVGNYELEQITNMLEKNPALDGIYLDSISGWVTRYPNYRRDHWRYAAGSLTYDRETGDLFMPGMVHTYEFMQALQQRLQPNGKVVFPNLGRARRNAFLYFVTDVVGLESGILTGDIPSRMRFYRTMAYHKPVLIMEYLEVLGKPTRHATPEGFERFWKWCLTYGCYPSIGRTCAEAYEQFGDIYRRFREPLRRVTQAGWEPMTHATVTEGILVERFGSWATQNLCFVLYNPGEKEIADAAFRMDANSLGLPDELQMHELFSDHMLPGPTYQLQMPAGAIALLAPGKPQN